MSRRRRHTPPFDLRIERLAPKSCGEGEHEGRTVLVRGAPPGGVVHVRPFKVKRGVLHARRVAMVEPPPNAVTPRCEVFGLCGGCTLQELSLEAQRQAKWEMVQRDLAPLDGVTLHGITGRDQAYGYRNKVELSFGVRRFLSEEDHAKELPIAGTFLGFHAPGRFDRVVNASRCELVPDALNAVISVVQDALGASSLAPWDVRSHTGFWKHLVLRQTRTDQVLVALYTAEPDGPEALQELKALAAALAEQVPELKGVCWFVNARVADAAIGELREVLYGEPQIEERLGERRYQLSPTAFFQTNTWAAEQLYDLVGHALADGKRLLDLYCGTGAIGLYLADRFEQVLGVELNEESVRDARANAALNGLTGVEFVAGKVEENLPTLQPGDVAVVDPPRVGLHPKAAAWLAEQQLDGLVYVACKPSSLARDRVILEAGGWKMTELWAVDLFPQTGHVEAVARFVR